jgi:hypothetical protein
MGSCCKWMGGSGVALLLLVGHALAEEPKSSAPATMNELSLEVSALQILHHLSITPAQLRQLRKMAKDTTPPKAANAKPGQASGKFRTSLLELHKVLLVADEPGPVDDLTEKLEKLREEEKPDLDDDVEMTESARRHAPEALRLLGAPQVAGYLAGLTGEIGDPHSRLLEALEQVRMMSADQWKEFRTNFSDDIARLVAGVDAEKVDKVSDEVIQLLIVARSLKDDEFKAQRSELEKTARKITGDLGPFQVLQNVMENVLATLLSNPRLLAAIDARLQKK